MEKTIVVIRNHGHKGEEGVEEALRASGWTTETIEVSQGEPLPRCLENVGGVLILGDALNVYEQSTSPCLKVYTA
jgi:hypothetical protein